MANLNITNIPAPRVPFIDERTGLMAREWYRFFLNLFVLTGSGNNPITLEELQLGPPNQPDLAELLIQINQNIAPQYEDQSGDFLATLDTAQLMSMMSRFENAEAAIQGAYLQPVVQTGTIANYNLDGSPTAGGVAYGTGPALAVSAAGTVGQVLTSAGAGTPTWSSAAAGTVSSVSVVSANGLAGTVATATTTPAITLSTTVTGLLKGNGTAISAATSGTDYAPATSGTSILYGNGSGGFNNVTIGTGVAFAGGTLSATGSGGTVTSVTGTAPVVSSGGATPAISMAAATTSVNGYLTSTDWTTFNNKGSGTVTSVAALTLGTTGTDLSSTVATGTTTPVITLQVPTASASNRGALSAADWTTFNNKGSGTVTSVTGTAPVVSSGGATPAISMAAATTSVNGYLTSTDWTTFNSKQAALVSGTNIKTVNGTTLLGSGDLGTITYAYGGTGLTSYTAGDIIYASAANTVAKLAIGTSGQRLVVAAGLPSWATDTTVGTVTSVSFTGGIITVATATTTPALTVAGTSGGIPYFSSASTWASSAALAAGSLVLGGGAGVTPATTTTGTGVVAALGVNTGLAGAFVVNGGALGTPSSGTVTNLTGTASINTNGAHNGTVGATTPSSATFTTANATTNFGVGAAPANDFNVSFSKSGGTTIATFDNTSSGASSAASVQIRAGGSGGNSALVMGTNVQTTPVYWTSGINAADSNSYTISATSDFSASRLKIATGGAATFSSTLTVTSTALINTASILSGRALQVANTGTNDTVVLQSNGSATATPLLLWNTTTSGDNNFVSFFTETSITSRGSITYNRTAGLVSYNTTSDYRLKDLFGSYTGASTVLSALTVHDGMMKGTNLRRPMFVAHELQEVLPYAVTGKKDAIDAENKPTYQQVDHQIIVPLLTSGWQTHERQIQDLLARISELEKRLA